MFKAFGVDRDRPLIMLGFSGENMTRLMADEPIVIRFPEQAPKITPPVPRCTILVVGGRTEQAIADQVRAVGVKLITAGQPGGPAGDGGGVPAGLGTDARLWAQQFAARFAGSCPEPELLQVWFAAAIEAGRGR